jgi:D-amino-acid dehydrogenase
MHIGIVGAGFVGVCAALELSLRGHRVEVFERRGGIATESSFAGAGILCPTALPSLGRHPTGGTAAPGMRRPDCRPAPASRRTGWPGSRLLARLFEIGEDWLEQLEAEHRLE